MELESWETGALSLFRKQNSGLCERSRCDVLIIRRKFEIGAHPDDRDIIVNELKELGCVLPDVKYYKTEMFGHEIVRVYIKDAIDADKMDSLIEWLQTEIKSIVSITF